jgi:LPXTG-site transpeptidase (sortase) family protein
MLNSERLNQLTNILSVVFVLCLVGIIASFFGKSYIGQANFVNNENLSEKIYSNVLDDLFPQDAQIIEAESSETQVFSEYKYDPSIPFDQYQPLESFQARLSISSINIDGPIVNGTTEKTMNRGFWHYPSSSPLQQHKNVVIIGHRFYKMPPHKDTFFNLDKTEVGTEIVIRTNVMNFYYQVTEKKVIEAKDTWILNQTDHPQLTLITCHPLWTSRQRLVIISRLVKAENNL